VTAASALEGFNLLQEAVDDGKPFRLLISDVHMPRIDGFGLAGMIKANASLSGLDIIFLTSAGEPGQQRRCEELGIAAQMTKPVKLSELYNVVIRTLGIGEQPEDGWLVLDDSDDRELPPQRILLVEDSIPNQKLALAVLSGAGHAIVVANDGQEALAVLKTQSFDLILMDVQMPVMDGLEATAAIRAAEQGTGRHRQAPADRRHDRPRHAGRPRTLSGCGYGRLRFKAGRPRSAGSGDGQRDRLQVRGSLNVRHPAIGSGILQSGPASCNRVRWKSLSTGLAHCVNCAATTRHLRRSLSRTSTRHARIYPACRRSSLRGTPRKRCDWPTR
jgi:CheY-like chemotaxis protein